MHFISTAVIFIFALIAEPFGSGFLLQGYAKGNLGELELSDSMVEAFFEVREPQEAEFDFRSTYFSLDWDFAEKISSRVTLGQQELILTPARYGEADDDKDFTLIEAYGLLQSSYGDVSFGLIPIEFGLEGGGRENELLFSRALFYQAAMTGLRDLGFRYYVKNGPFSTHFMVHNGEGGADKDNRIWFTTQWDWHKGNWIVGLAGTTGKTTPVSTFQTGNPSDLTVFDPEEKAEWRIVNFHSQFVDRYLTVRLEGFTGHVRQNLNGENEFFAGYLSVARLISGKYTAGIRYDFLEPDNRLSRDRFSEITLLLAWHDLYQASRLYLEAIKSLEPNSGVFDDRIRLVWRLSPSGQAFSDRFR